MNYIKCRSAYFKNFEDTVVDTYVDRTKIAIFEKLKEFKHENASWCAAIDACNPEIRNWKNEGTHWKPSKIYAY